MTRHSTTPADETTLFLGDGWSDPLEAGIRDRIRDFIEKLIEEELAAALGRGRYERRPASPAKPRMPPATPWANGSCRRPATSPPSNANLGHRNASYALWACSVLRPPYRISRAVNFDWGHGLRSAACQRLHPPLGCAQNGSNFRFAAGQGAGQPAQNGTRVPICRPPGRGAAGPKWK